LRGEDEPVNDAIVTGGTGFIGSHLVADDLPGFHIRCTARLKCAWSGWPTNTRAIMSSLAAGCCPQSGDRGAIPGTRRPYTTERFAAAAPGKP